MDNAKDIPYDEMFETRIRQVAESLRAAIDGLSMLLSGLVDIIESPGVTEYLSDEVKEALASTDVGELKDRVTRLQVASEVLSWLQSDEALTLLSTVQNDKLATGYQKIGVGIYKLQKFLGGRSTL
ncbi:MAG: hypothetical protein AB1597_04760 [Chloroflexota bacterium]